MKHPSGRDGIGLQHRPSARAASAYAGGRRGTGQRRQGGNRRVEYRGQERGRTGVEGADRGAFDRCRFTVPVGAATSGRLNENERERSIDDTAGRYSPLPRHQDAGSRA